MSNIEIYSDSELELKVSINEDTIWLTQKQIAEVFDVNVPAISDLSTLNQTNNYYMNVIFSYYKIFQYI